MKRRDFMLRGPALAAGLSLGGATAKASAQAALGGDYPQRPIRILVGYPAGGGIDTITRLFAERFSATIKQPVVIENRGGAGGMVAAEALARAQADGYTLGMMDSGVLTIQPNIRKSVAYSILKDFAYVGLVAKMPLVLVAHPSLPASNLTEIVRYSKANPTAVVFGSGGGVGNPTHISYEFLKQATGASILHVAYQGAAPALTDLVGGHIALTFVDVRLAQDYAKDGRVKIIAIGDSRRHPLLPNTPTFDESGVPNVAQPPTVGLAGPASIPKNVVAKLNEAFARLSEDGELSDTLTRRGYAPAITRSDDYVALVRSDFEANRKSMQELKISLD
ncbi:MAG: Bug family tripartite tricarboxylate transporter substrate binding protein [Vicinamibacterales bacterium]